MASLWFEIWRCRLRCDRRYLSAQSGRYPPSTFDGKEGTGRFAPAAQQRRRAGRLRDRDLPLPYLKYTGVEWAPPAFGYVRARIYPRTAKKRDCNSVTAFYCSPFDHPNGIIAWPAMYNMCRAFSSNEGGRFCDTCERMTTSKQLDVYEDSRENLKRD